MRQLSVADEARYAELIEMTARIKKLAEEESQFKRGQLIRACRHLSVSFNPNPTCQDDVLVPTNPHDHNDPEQHFWSRVMGWDCMGRIEIAIPYGDNPHCCDWCWSEDMLEERPGPDWADASKFKPNQVVYYTWDSGDFFDIRRGMEIRAILDLPHIQPGDWRVRYDNTSSGPITRVVKESQMRTSHSGPAPVRWIDPDWLDRHRHYL